MSYPFTYLQVLNMDNGPAPSPVQINHIIVCDTEIVQMCTIYGLKMNCTKDESIRVKPM